MFNSYTGCIQFLNQLRSIPTLAEFNSQTSRNQFLNQFNSYTGCIQFLNQLRSIPTSAEINSQTSRNQFLNELRSIPKPAARSTSIGKYQNLEGYFRNIEGIFWFFNLADFIIYLLPSISLKIMLHHCSPLRTFRCSIIQYLAFVLKVKFLSSKSQNWSKKAYFEPYFDNFLWEIWHFFAKLRRKLRAKSSEAHFHRKFRTLEKCSNVKKL